MFTVFQRDEFAKVSPPRNAMVPIPASYRPDSVRKGKRTVTALARAANDRLSELPSYIGVSGLRPVRINAKEKQARATGKQRRLLMPVLWVAVMVLNAAKLPDEDHLLRTTLLMDQFFAELKGVNKSTSCLGKLKAHISEFQSLGRQMVASIDSLLEISTSTKLHRIASHIEDQIVNLAT